MLKAIKSEESATTSSSWRRELKKYWEKENRWEEMKYNQFLGPSSIILQISAFFLGFKETCNSLVDGFSNKRPSLINSSAIFLASPI